MVGKKGRSGRKRKYHNNPVADRIRKSALAYYYKHREARNKYSREYHKKNLEILKYAAKHKISIPEARKRLAKEQTK